MVFKEIGEFFGQLRLAGEVLQLQALLELVKSPEYEEIEDKVERSLNTPGKINELVNSKNWMERLTLAECLEITPDMPEESLKEAKNAAKKLAHDSVWAVRCVLAMRSDIEPGFFKEIAEELKKDKDWRVIIGLASNEKTPKEIISWIEEHNKKVLKRLQLEGKLEDLASLLRK